ncbi:MAG: D-alanine--D-alanine ligase [Cardiobacteriaceae bacterium]|nr:D-alanine--D-alanine ligase [Cardiobacteriaceae bacterium]
MDVKRFGKVAVLYGGTSAEREVSLNSGAAIFEALKEAGVEAHLVDTQTADALFQLKTQNFDRAFIALHGRGGEDGQTQAVLDYLGLPYTGSGVLACALAMDKVLTKKVWQAMGLPVLADQVLSAKDLDFKALCERYGAKRFAVKPALEGSSVGVSCVGSQEELLEAYEKAGGALDKVMIEPWVQGRELTVAVVGERVLPVIEVAASAEHAFYDYDAKYLAEDTRYLCPAPLTDEQSALVQQLAKQAFDGISARGWARVDMMLDERGQPWLLEINLSPGMTSHSLVPMAAKAVGLSFQALVLTVLEQTIA